MTAGSRYDSSQRDYAGLFRLDGQGFVVLGAGGGIGEQVVRAIAGLGGRALCVDIDEEAVETVATDLGMPWIAADATAQHGVEDVVAAAQGRLGEINGFVDVIGRMLPASITGYGLEQWEADFAINLRHALLAGGRLAPLVTDGAIVFVSSVGGTHGSLFSPGYGPTKAALEVWVKELAAEHGPRGVRVNAVAPGLFLSPRVADSGLAEAADGALSTKPLLRRLGQPHEVAATIAFLLTPAAGNITAATIPVEGGALSRDSTGLDELHS